MANYKLSNDNYWEASGVYDIDQAKTQRQINGSVADTLGLLTGTKTVSGRVVSFEDGIKDYLCKSVVVDISAWQQGTPTPESPKTINGFTSASVRRTGTNLWSSAYNRDGKLHFFPTYASAASIYNATDFTRLLKVVKSKTYYVRIESPNTGSTTWGAYGGKKSVKSQINHTTMTSSTKNFTFTPTTDDWWIIWLYKSSNWTSTESSNVKLHIATKSSSTLIPYEGTITTISFPSEAGTVYGGTLDVTNGILTVTKEYISSYNGETLNGIWMSSMDVYAEGTTPTIGAAVIHDREEPLVYQVASNDIYLLQGENNIWSTTGDVTVEYGEYLVSTPDKLPKKCVAPVELTTKASKEYITDELFFMGDKLFIATATIASGATFTVGTNCAETTLGEQIAALRNA